MRALVCMMLVVTVLAVGCQASPPSGSSEDGTIALVVLPIPHVKTMGWNDHEFYQLYDGFTDRTEAKVIVLAPEENVVGPKNRQGENIAVQYLYEVDPETIDVLVIIGGSGPIHWRNNSDLHAWLQQLAALERPMGGVCGGVTILAAAGLLAGCDVATNSQYQSYLESQGATYIGEGLERDGQFWTFSYGSEADFLDAFLPVYAEMK